MISALPVFVSCDELDLIGGENPDEELHTIDEYLNLEITKLKAFSARFEGMLTVDDSALSSTVFILYYSDEMIVDPTTLKCVYIANFDQDKSIKIDLRGLECNKKYYYVLYVKHNSIDYYSEVFDFTTAENPHEKTYDLDVTSAVDLSAAGSANSYIVSEPGLYKIRTVKGNSNESIGAVSSASILWETYGTDEDIYPGDLVEGVCCKDGYIIFQTSDLEYDNKGNALIAAHDAVGTILWSWHIWFTEQPKGQVYYNDAGTMMDRNLGATTALPDDVHSLGLLYQWGRKDPFLNTNSIEFHGNFADNVRAKSTGSWPTEVVLTSPEIGTIEYTIVNPMTCINSYEENEDWFYTGNITTDNTRWTTSDKEKSIYDPCPYGWRVPDGGPNGVWAKALGTSEKIANTNIQEKEAGVNLSGLLGDDEVIWYPESGFVAPWDCSNWYVGWDGRYWSATPSDNRFNTFMCYGLTCNYFDWASVNKPETTSVTSVALSSRRYAYAVRCIKE